MISYFEMKGLPPLAHSQDKYKLIIERDCYVHVFKAIFERAKSRLANGWGTTMHVSGNPGIGKSRFYLYFIIRLLSERELISTYRLVINFISDYFLYDSVNAEFIRLDKNEVKSLQEDRTVLRLIEANSDQLIGWKGVSVLFASPGVDRLYDYLKIESYRFYLPIWTFKEIYELNSMLDAPLVDSILSQRFGIFGGIPRFIFTDAEEYEKVELALAIDSFDVLRVLSYVKGKIVREKDNSHRILCMIPSEDFRSILYLDFLSQHIAENVVDKVADDSINAISTICIPNSNDDSAVIRGRIYEILSHRLGR
jgi:hypothetical protein